jgi:hypothetical protein
MSDFNVTGVKRPFTKESKSIQLITAGNDAMSAGSLMIAAGEKLIKDGELMKAQGITKRNSGAKMKERGVDLKGVPPMSKTLVNYINHLPHICDSIQVEYKHIYKNAIKYKLLGGKMSFRDPDDEIAEFLRLMGFYVKIDRCFNHNMYAEYVGLADAYVRTLL